jgi:hypothetical protein
MARGAKAAATTNKTFRVPLAVSLQNRNSSLLKDQRLINCFAEAEKNPVSESKKAYVIRRPGLAARRTYTVGAGRGCYRWKGADYVAIGNTLYKDGASHQTISGTSGHVGFTVLFDGITEKLFFCDGTNGFVTNGTTVIQIPTTYATAATTTAYALGARRIPVSPNGFFYEVITAGTSAGSAPAWPTVIDDEIADGSVVWRCAGYYGFAYGGWPVGAAVTSGRRIIPSVSNGFFYECITGGTTAGSEPAWPTIIGNTVTDNTVLWRCEGVEDLGAPMPSDHIPFPVVLDQTLYLIAKNADGTNSQSIYNSGIKRPHSWNQIDFTDAEQFADSLVALARHHTTIAAFGSESLEFFYDNANPTGSPLSRNDQLAVKIGCPAGETIVTSEKKVFFVGTTTHGGYSVWEITNYTPVKISDEFVDRVLEAETTIGNARGYLAKSGGHEFYVLRLAAVTLVYDSEEKLWHEWSSNSGGNHAVFTGAYAADDATGKSMILGSADGELYTLNPAVSQDKSVDILTDIYTTKMDFESINRKFLHRFVILGDEVAAGSISLRWSDDDYVTWTNYFTISLAASPMELHRLGAFRRRAFHLRYTGNTSLRLEGIEAEISLGDH